MRRKREGEGRRAKGEGGGGGRKKGERRRERTVNTGQQLRNDPLLHFPLSRFSLETNDVHLVYEQDTRNATLQGSHDRSGDSHVMSHMTTLASENRCLREPSDSPETPLTISVAASRMRGRLIS